MERIYTMKKTLRPHKYKNPMLLAKVDLNENEVNSVVDFLRKFTGLWKESTRNGLPCFTMELEDETETVFFE